MSSMSRSVDIFVVYNDDAEVWHRYVIDHLGKAQYDLRLQAVTDTQLLGWINHVASADLSPSSGPETGDAAHRLMEASLSKAFIVVASPGHIRVLYENPVFNYARLIKNPERAQILMWGVEHSDLFHPPSMLSTRFPQLDQWTKVSPVRPDYLLTNAVIMIESFGTPSTVTHQQPQPNNTVTSSAYDVPSRTPRPRTLPFPAKNKLHLQSAVTFDSGSLSGSLKRDNKLIFDDDIPHSPAPPLPSTGIKLNFDNGSHYDSGNRREAATPPRNARWKRQDFRIQPVSARCEEPTTMFVFFDDPIAEMAGDVRLEVLVGDSGDKLSAEWVNPYAFSFIIPIHTEGLVHIKFILDGHDIGSRPLVFYSLTANIITGISQIYIEQIRSLLGALIRSHPAIPERHGTQSLKRNETIATVGRESAMNASWSATEIDQLMTKLFTGDSMEQIPVQAFEQIFGVYNHVDAATATQYECPTLVHLAAQYDLRELAAHLVDLPDARLACAVQNSRGQRSDEVAKQQGHSQLAKFLENFRLVDDNFHVTREHILSTNFTDETDGQCAPRARFSSLLDKSEDAAENTYMDMSVYVANSSTRTKAKIKPVPPLPPSSTPPPAAAATEECIDDVDDEDTSDYEKMDLRGLPVVRTTSTNRSSPNQLEPMSREKLTNPRRRLPPDPPPKLIRSDSIDEDMDDDYVEKSEYDAALIKQREIDTHRSISDTPSSIGTSTYDTPRQLTTGSSCSTINEHENDARLTAMDPPESGATNELMPAILFPNMEDSMCGQQHQQQQQVPLDDANPDLPNTFFTNSSVSEFPSVSVACKCDGHPQSLLNQEEGAADSNNNPGSCDDKRFPLHIELVGGALASPAEEVMSHSQLELVDIMRRVKENELTMDSAVQLFTGWKERHKRGLTRSFKEKKAQLEKIRHEIELSATSVTAEKSCGTKIKPKRSFSKILSFSKKSTHPTANEMSSPPSAPILCVPLSQSKIKKVQSLRSCKPMLNSSIPEDSQLVNVATPSGSDLSGREGVHLQVASVQRISSSSSSSAHSRDSYRSETSLTSGIADLDVNTDDDEVQVRQTKKLLQPSSGLTSLVLHRRSKNLEMLVKDLSESSQPPPPPIPPRIVPRPVPEATLSPCAHQPLQPLAWSENSNTPSRDVGLHLATTDHVTAADNTSHTTTTTTEHRSDIGSRTGDALGIEARHDRPQLPPRNVSTTNMATLEKSVSCESSFGQLTIQIPTYRKGSLPGDVCIDGSSPQPLSVFDVPAGHVSRQLTTAPDDANTQRRLQRSMSPCPSRPLPPVPTRPN